MPRSGSGVWTAPSGTFNPAVSGATPTAADWTAFLADLTTAISASIASDGQTTASARIPFAAGVSVPAGGVQFPATQSASSDANNLDDYEEGTFTPGLSFGGGTTGLTYGSRTGRYIKVGKLVWVSIYILLSAKGSSTGSALITGLPFACVNVATPLQTGSGYLATMTSLNASAPQFYPTPNATTVTLTVFSSSDVITVTHAFFQDTSVIGFTGQYEAAA